MPKIGLRTLEDAALAARRPDGKPRFSRGQAKKAAASVVARDDWPFIQGVLAERFWLDHADPTAWDAIWNVLTEQLAANHVTGAAVVS